MKKKKKERKQKKKLIKDDAKSSYAFIINNWVILTAIWGMHLIK